MVNFDENELGNYGELLKILKPQFEKYGKERVLVKSLNTIVDNKLISEFKIICYLSGADEKSTKYNYFIVTKSSYIKLKNHLTL